MTTGPPCSHRRVWRVLARRTGSALILLLTTVVLECAPTAASSVAVEPGRASSPTAPASPSPSVPTPTTHSYDDADIEQRSEGSSPALWILVGALAGLVAIGAILLRAGTSPRDHHV